MRKIITSAAVLLLLLSAILLWRARHPKLTDAQQISANLDEIVLSANERQPGGIIDFLSPKFKWPGGNRKDFQNALVGGILQFRVVDLGLSNLKIGVKGDSATSDGRFSLSLKPEYDSPPEIHVGDFELKWKKEAGDWMITEIEGEVPRL